MSATGSGRGSASTGRGAISGDTEEEVSRELAGGLDTPPVAGAGGPFDATCVGGADFFAAGLPRFSTGGPVSLSSIARCLGVAAIWLRSTPSLGGSGGSDVEAVAAGLPGAGVTPGEAAAPGGAD